MSYIIYIVGTAYCGTRSWTRYSTPTRLCVLRFRTALVPLANIGSSLSYIIIMAGIFLTALGSAFGSTALWIGAGLMSLAVLFSIVTLPVEFDASSRAMKQITALNIVNEKNINMRERYYQQQL